MEESSTPSVEPSPFDPLPCPNLDKINKAGKQPPMAILNANLKLKNPKLGEGRKRQTLSRVIQKFINSRHPAALDEQGRTRFLRILDNMCRIASSKSPLAVQAASLLLDRGWGKARSSDEDLDAIAKQGGIQIVYVAPTELEDVTTAKAALPQPSPEFIEGEILQ